MCKVGLWKRIIYGICAFAILSLTCMQSAMAALNNAEVEVPGAVNGYICEFEWLTDTDFIIRGYLDGILIHEVTGRVGGETILSKEYDEEGNILKTETITVSDIIREAPQEVVDELDEAGLTSGTMPAPYPAFVHKMILPQFGLMTISLRWVLEFTPFE